MAAYWLARARVADPVEYKRYTDRVPDIMKKYGARIHVRGGDFKVMEGPERFTRFIVVEFPTFEAAVSCFESDEYRAAAEFRRNGAGEVEITIVDGGDATPR
ncbi:DUF1330 domain-containing protein [Paraburkholderia largidicola]|uniref:DUF1330 domain-containing protein n=1 Tax=Paraburkholderia largidicola TaxID=3014751 RepID=A0A7I8C1T6_9BURK|nr:DUF1330 domain-containing protein [Paraburkholderia sp. PGU16]BCF95046.1 hypothetical protein PPGU16_81130 [Paraburkholderia sp. PGU16]